MKLLLDTANVAGIKEAAGYYPVCGVTTNPSIISREESDFFETLKKIRSIIGEDQMLHAQVTAHKAEGMIEEAKRMKDELGKNFYVKIPATKEGIKAIMELKSREFQVTATAVVSAKQGLIAAMAGADFVAPYVNRIDHHGGDGIKTAADLTKVFREHHLSAKILAASFKNTKQVFDIALSGSYSATVSLQIMEDMLKHPLTDTSLETFDSDWKAAYGEKHITDF